MGVLMSRMNQRPHSCHPTQIRTGCTRLRDRHWKRLRQQHGDGTFCTHGEHQRENTWRALKRKYKKSTRKKTQGEYPRERDLENIEQILITKDITGPLKLQGYKSF